MSADSILVSLSQRLSFLLQPTRTRADSLRCINCLVVWRRMQQRQAAAQAQVKWWRREQFLVGPTQSMASKKAIPQTKVPRWVPVPSAGADEIESAWRCSAFSGRLSVSFAEGLIDYCSCSFAHIGHMRLCV